MIQRKRILTKIAVGVFLLGLCGTGAMFLRAQKNGPDATVLLSTNDDTESQKVLIETFWKLCEQGKVKEARKLRTNVSGENFSLIVKDPIKSWEEIISESGMSLLGVGNIKAKGPDEHEVAVKVKNRNGREFYLFHYLVKTNNGWKITTITR